MQLQTTRSLSYIIALTVVQTFRVGGAVFLFELQRGNLPTTFAIPAGIGDVLVGITAPIIALLLRKRTTVAWITAITWNALGITDLVYAFTLALLSQAQYVLTSYLVIIPTFFVPLFVVLHVITILVLMRKQVRMLFN